MTEEKRKLTWGAHWLLPEEHSAAWGARAIADKQYKYDKWTGSHIASLLPDRQSGAGNNENLKALLAWLKDRILPISLIYDGSSRVVTEVNDGEYHARWTPNGSFGYIYIVAWVD